MPTYFIAPLLNASSVNWAATSTFSCLSSTEPISDGNINDPDMFGRILVLNSSGNLQFLDFYDFNISNLEYYANFASFPVTGELQVLYLDNATSEFYRWNGSSYTAVCSNYAPKASPTLTGTTTIAALTTTGTTNLKGAISGNSAAGDVGEVMESTQSGTSLTTETAKTICTVNLTAGRWLLSGGSSATGSSLTGYQVVITSTLNGVGTNVYDRIVEGYTDTAQTWRGAAATSQYVSVSSTTSWYLNATAVFASGTATAYGKLTAVRIA